jgi:SAM-dependent MidA family methyltransferase
MSQLTNIIKAEIASQGAISFARFMELALYCPEYGFYERESETVGRAGDFYTSVSVGPLFGELLAFQFAEWLAAMPGEKLQLVEAGAHDGKLAADILQWLAKHRSEIYSRLEYVILEPSARRQAWQQRRLRELGQKVRWLDTSLESSGEKFKGIIFANELLDAFPVRRLGWDGSRREWFEWGVTWKAGKFAWMKLNGAINALETNLLPEELLSVLPDNFSTEICPAAEKWWTAAANSLQRGWLVTLDYGLVAEDFFAPHRARGTLRAYRRHRGNGDVLAEPGEQDITAQVNFSRLQNAGETVGLSMNIFETQSEFIMGIAKNFWTEAQRAGVWGATQNRELQTLVHPEHLGRAFRVLAQSRGVVAGLTDAGVGHIA